MQLIITGRHPAWSGAGVAGSERRTAGHQAVQIKADFTRFQRDQQRRFERVAIRAGNGEVAAFDDGVVQAVSSLPEQNDADSVSNVVEAAQPDATSDERQRLLASG